MDDNPIRLEYLPNEILSDIFEYLDARDLYRAFYNLNLRFNILLRSLNELSLILSICDRDEITDNAIFLPYIHTLIVKYRTDIKFNHYTNIRRLILFWFTYTRPYKLETVILPYLEYLSIHLKGSSSSFSMTRLHEMIFSNGFPCLKYCSLPKISPIQKTERWTTLPSVRILKVGHIGLFTYISILSTCPNLYSFHFFEEKVLQTSVVLTQYVNHKNLKQLVIKDKYIGPILHAGVLNEYLSCVPNLEYLSIHGTTYHMKNLKYLLEFDWFASIISMHLSFLHQFNFHLPIFQSKRMNNLVHEETFHRLEQRFKIMHKNRYQSRLIENRKNSKDLIYYDSSDLSD
jgi:hypothetical protein